MTKPLHVVIDRHVRYHIDPTELDEFPIGSFFLKSVQGSHNDPSVAMRLVRPSEAKNYTSTQLSPGKNLLYYFWRRIDRGEAVKLLGAAGTKHVWRWVIQPGEDGYDTLDAFKIVCDHRVGKPVSDRMIREALGLTQAPVSSIV